MVAAILAQFDILGFYESATSLLLVDHDPRHVPVLVEIVSILSLLEKSSLTVHLTLILLDGEDWRGGAGLPASSASCFRISSCSSSNYW